MPKPMNPGDETLSRLLRRWRDIEPSGDFEANVWRRIRLGQAGPIERAALVEFLQRLLGRPAFSVAAAAALGVAVGVWGGTRLAPKPATAERAEFGFLGPGTLAGGYAQLARGGAR